jgi:4-alpha-glucanotransferase
MNSRSSGILLHPTSLSNPYPIGDLGPSATAFVDFLVLSGQSWWQMLPIGPTGIGNSPYQSSSAFAGNQFLLSPDLLIEHGFLNRGDIESHVPGAPGKVDYFAMEQLKLKWFKKAYEQFEKKGGMVKRLEFEAFVRAESFWLNDFSLYLAVRDNEGTGDWTKWARELRTRKPEALVRARKHFTDDIRYHQFIQWQFSIQWKELRAYCESKAVQLIGDIPLFVSHESADVWVHPEIFKLDADGNMTVVAGVPPDYFTKTGQRWGEPVYRWDVLQGQNYNWWIERLRTALGRFGVIRLDHFIGYVRTYEVPSGDLTAENGQYQPGGGSAFFEAVSKALGSLPFIAEDLGVLTPEVIALREQLNLPGSRVLQFEFESELEKNIFPSKELPVNSVVYTGTHDNDTTEGWYRKLPTTQRKSLRKHLGANDQTVVRAMILAAMASRADRVIVPAQDLLDLGTEARMNIPGTVEGNWQWRLKDDALTTELAQRLRNLTGTCGRLGSEGHHSPPLRPDDNPSEKNAKLGHEPYEGQNHLNDQTDKYRHHAEGELKAEGKGNK